MARWVLNCPDCSKDFTHSEIPDAKSFGPDPYTASAVKPEFPKGGLTVACPNCKSKSIYQRYELTYRAF